MSVTRLRTFMPSAATYVIPVPFWKNRCPCNVLVLTLSFPKRGMKLGFG